MEDSLAIIATIFICIIGLWAFLLIIRSFEKPFLLHYISASAFFLIGTGISVFAVFGFFPGIWVLPAIAAVMAMIMLGSFIWSIAGEERFLYKYKKLKEPIDPVDVERGLDWKKVEKWLMKNSK